MPKQECCISDTICVYQTPQTSSRCAHGAAHGEDVNDGRVTSFVLCARVAGSIGLCKPLPDPTPDRWCARGAALGEGVDDGAVAGLRSAQQRAAAQAVAQVGVGARAQQHLHHICMSLSFK